MRAGLFVLALILGLFSSAIATTYHLEPDGSGQYLTIAQAVAACVDGDVIELADGRYAGNGNNNIEIDDLSITIRSVSGSAGACWIDCEGTPAVTNRAFSIEGHSGDVVTLENFAIEGGNAHAEGGGGIYAISGVTLLLNNVRFRNCHALIGGAISLPSDLTTVIAHDCHFIENTGEGYAGAVEIEGATTEWYGCRFIANSSGGNAGAILRDFYGSTEFHDCTFSRNLCAGVGGAILDVGGGSLTLRGCTFFENASTSGAIITISGTAPTSIGNCMIVGSSAGAAIDWTPPAVDLYNCNLFENAGGNYTGSLAGQLGINDNISADPQFCSEIPHEHQNWTLQEDSPCTALNSQAGIQIGAFGRDCGTTDAQPTRWGALKKAFR